MNFRIEQPIDAPRAQVIAALTDPDFYVRRGDSDKVRPPEVVDWREDGDAVHLQIRYRFTGDLSSAARAILDPDHITWVVETEISRTSGDAAFVFLPDNYPDRLSCDGAYTFEEGGDTTTQRLEGRIRVRVPIVNRAVENAIVSGLREHLAEQAAALAAWTPPRTQGATPPRP